MLGRLGVALQVSENLRDSFQQFSQLCGLKMKKQLCECHLHKLVKHNTQLCPCPDQYRDICKTHLKV